MIVHNFNFNRQSVSSIHESVSRSLDLLWYEYNRPLCDLFQGYCVRFHPFESFSTPVDCEKCRDATTASDYSDASPVIMKEILKVTAKSESANEQQGTDLSSQSEVGTHKHQSINQSPKYAIISSQQSNTKEKFLKSAPTSCNRIKSSDVITKVVDSGPYETLACSEIEDLNSSSQKKLGDPNSSNQPQLDDLNSSNQPQLEDLNSSNQPQLDDLNSSNQPRLDDLNSSNQPQLDDLNSPTQPQKEDPNSSNQSQFTLPTNFDKSTER